MSLQFPYRRSASRRLGRVADFCALCRKPTAQALRMHGQALHWYGLRIGPIALEDYTRSCESCDTVYSAEEGHYRSLSRWQRLPIDALIASTQPGLAKKYERRLELEARLLLAPELLTPGERHALVREPFELLSVEVANALRSKPWDVPTVAALAFALVVPLPAAAFFMDVFPGAPERMLWIGGGLFAAGLLAAIVLNHGSPDRFLRRRIFPRIARALRPLEPTAAEIATAMAQQLARDRRFGTARHVDAMLAVLAAR